ncbi:MAG TPA: single-stranded-DNA-specific exonuclease RecJ [Solirubrobacteraceae bacterium]|jgi:single-stranded-DNA-specific exonuclease|nr:single-stranded-DNA-specific exonuclease RecJ [Solirubrobacteraceae bacterium]
MAGVSLLDHTSAVSTLTQSEVPGGRQIELPPYDLTAALTLRRELGVSHALAQILVRRGYDEPAAVRAFLDPQERHEPGLFAGMAGALEVIERHIGSGSRIVVHGDYDVDGVCATAVLVRALRSLGADAGWYLPSRSEDGYGLSAATVARLSESGTGLLVTVDCGITAFEQVAQARAAGIEVVVTDHHSPRGDGELPDCPIVHPTVGGYPTRDLCGTAVAHKLAEALGAPTAEEDVELVALATVADLMPLRGENRRIVRDGLVQMAGTQRVGLRALMRVSRTDPSALDASCLAFRLAPRINAAGRMRRADAGLELLLTDDPQRAEAIASELDAVNADRRAVEQRITWEADALATEMGERSSYVLAAPGWHAGVIGIVASRIVDHHHRPAILLAIDPSNPAAPAHGSGRSIPGFDLLGALDATGEHLVTYGGHRAAAGLSVLPEQIPAFRDAFERHAEEVLTPDLLAPVERVDAVVSGADLSLELAEELLALAPFGNGNPEVRLYVAGATFDGLRTMGDSGQHVRFNVNSGGVRASAVAFGCDGHVAGADGMPTDASFKLERNLWKGVVEPRLVLQHAAPCMPTDILVLGEPDDYLTTVFMELDRELDFVDDPDLASKSDPACEIESQPSGDLAAAGERTVLDRRGQSSLTTIADAQAASGPDNPILVICANTPRRLAALASRRGGFALISHDSLEDEPELVIDFEHIVVLDPPASATQDAIAKIGSGYTHLAWGEAELRFAQQMHEQEYALRASLVALYRALKGRAGVAGEELEHLLRGDETHARPARLSGRLLRVFTELGLVSLDPDLPSLSLADAQPTELERSVAYRVYTKTSEDGQRFLSGSKPRRAS